MFAFLFMLTGCLSNSIEITPEYIINGNWNEEANAIIITKMKVKEDSTLNPFLDLTQEEILDKLVTDSSFTFFGNVTFNGEKYTTRKVYFNEYNGFLWLRDIHGIAAGTNTIGSLLPGNWYKFSCLFTHPRYIYVYVDSAKHTHQFDVNLANF